MDIRRERKVVTVLFVDLVGFTARSESMDPEDVEVELSRYHTHVRSQLERFGGTVEKFIGDAVMALFGAPVTHEDDAERAVRAALAVRDWATGEGGLDVRIGVNTGEALVRVGASAESGESIAVGDVVNTAARLQTAAPTNGVIVGDTTYRLTRSAVEFETTDAVVAKGKAAPVQAWVAVDARARHGVDVLVAARTPFVGREHELGLLRASLARVRTEREPQLVTLVGVPGIGKSRLLHELSQLVDADPELVPWRQGRCLPYGDGVSLWALAEIVKADAGILENDGPLVAEEKLAKTLDARDAAADTDWLLTRLRPLVGVLSAEEAQVRREEQFAAWRQFIEGLADSGPAVVVFEDLHWADDTLLDFLDELIELTSGVPLFVVATARPELLVKRPSWGAGRTNTLTLSLQPLSAELTAMLVAELLPAADVPAELQSEVLARAEGNPLYAEEFARMLAEKPGAGLRLPETVQGIVAARLDTLEPSQKRLLQLGAVIGKVFWASAVATLAGVTAADVEEQLRALERRDLVRRERRSSMAGDVQYAFRHIVARDVAYGQIPRADRGALHRAVAEWFATLGRPEDHAELIAHHYVAAIEFFRASGTAADDLANAARHALRDAGERAVSLGSHAVAAEFFAKALELSPDLLERAELLHALGRAQWWATGSMPPAMEEAIELFERLGLHERAAEAAILLGRTAALNSFSELSEQWLARAEELLVAAPESMSRHWLTLTRGGILLIGGRYRAALELVAPEIDALEGLGRPDLLARGLDILGASLNGIGDESGFDLQRRAVEVARTHRAVWELQVALNNLTSTLVGAGRVREVQEVLDARRETFETFGGSAETRTWYHLSVAGLAYYEGRWDEALDHIERVVDQTGPTSLSTAILRPLRARVLMARDPDYDPRPDLDLACAMARQSGEGKTLVDALTHSAGVLGDIGAVEEARPLWEQALALLAAEPGIAAADETVDFAWAALAVGGERDARNVLARMDSQDGVPSNLWRHAAVLLVQHDFARAADRLDEIGDQFSAARANLRAGGDRIPRALEFFRRAGAYRYIMMAEGQLVEDSR